MSAEPGNDAETSPRTFVTERQFARRLFILSAFLAFGIILWLTIDLLLLIFGSVIVAVLLHAIADPVARHTPVPEHLALAAAVIGLLIIFGLAGWFFGSEIQSQAANLGDRVPEAWSSFQVRSAPPWRPCAACAHPNSAVDDDPAVGMKHLAGHVA